MSNLKLTVTDKADYEEIKLFCEFAKTQDYKITFIDNGNVVFEKDNQSHQVPKTEKVISPLDDSQSKMLDAREQNSSRKGSITISADDKCKCRHRRDEHHADYNHHYICDGSEDCLCVKFEVGE